MHAVARVMTKSQSSEVLVSRVVTDLVAGAGLKFSERGLDGTQGPPRSMGFICCKRLDSGPCPMLAPLRHTDRHGGCHAHRRPAQLRHQLRQTSVRASCAAALRHLKHVQEGLSAQAFQATKFNLAADTLQRCRLSVGYGYIRSWANLAAPLKRMEKLARIAAWRQPIDQIASSSSQKLT